MTGNQDTAERVAARAAARVEDFMPMIWAVLPLLPVPKAEPGLRMF